MRASRNSANVKIIIKRLTWFLLLVTLRHLLRKGIVRRCSRARLNVWEGREGCSLPSFPPHPPPPQPTTFQSNPLSRHLLNLRLQLYLSHFFPRPLLFSTFPYTRSANLPSSTRMALDFDDLIATMKGSGIGQEACDLRALHVRLPRLVCFLKPPRCEVKGRKGSEDERCFLLLTPDSGPGLQCPFPRATPHASSCLS